MCSGQLPNNMAVEEVLLQYAVDTRCDFLNIQLKYVRAVASEL